MDWAVWHFPGGPVGPPARWAATSNVEGGSGTGEGAQGLLAREKGLYLDICAGARMPTKPGPV